MALKRNSSPNIKIVFTIPHPTPSPNLWTYSHWRKYYGIKKKWYKYVVDAVVSSNNGKHFQRRYAPVTVRVHRSGKQLLDHDNLHASVKPLLDALRPPTMKDTAKCGIILDDDPGNLTLEVTQSKGEPGTVVEISSLMYKEPIAAGGSA